MQVKGTRYYCQDMTLLVREIVDTSFMDLLCQHFEVLSLSLFYCLLLPHISRIRSARNAGKIDKI